MKKVPGMPSGKRCGRDGFVGLVKADGPVPAHSKPMSHRDHSPHRSALAPARVHNSTDETATQAGVHHQKQPEH